MKSKRKYYIRTPYGDQYYIHSDGAIERADGHNGPGSQSWTLLGLASTHPFSFGSVRVSFPKIGEWLATNPKILHKNGKPMFTVVDNDHGSMRVWGNTAHHGIAEIREVSR